MNNNDEKNRYTKRNIIRSEQIYGLGFQSPGGVGLTQQLLDNYFHFSNLVNAHNKLEILDIGCGLGGLEVLLTEKFNNIKITGMDISAEMIEICQERYAGKQSMDFIVGDVLNTQLFNPESFDIIITRDCLLYIEDKDAIWRNVSKWLKPAGRLVLTDFGKGQQISKETEAYYKKCSYYLQTFDEYSKSLTGNGFTINSAGNITDLFNRFNVSDLEKFVSQKDKFLSIYDEDDYNYIVNRWDFKIKQSKTEEMLYYFFVATKN